MINFNDNQHIIGFEVLIAISRFNYWIQVKFVTIQVVFESLPLKIGKTIHIKKNLIENLFNEQECKQTDGLICSRHYNGIGVRLPSTRAVSTFV